MYMKRKKIRVIRPKQSHTLSNPTGDFFFFLKDTEDDANTDCTGTSYVYI